MVILVVAWEVDVAVVFVEGGTGIMSNSWKYTASKGGLCLSHQ